MNTNGTYIAIGVIVLIFAIFAVFVISLVISAILRINSLEERLNDLSKDYKLRVYNLAEGLKLEHKIIQALCKPVWTDVTSKIKDFEDAWTKFGGKLDELNKE